MTYNPYKEAEAEAEEVKDNVGIDVGIVVGVNYDTHSVAFREMTKTGTENYNSTPDQAVVPIDVRGDVALPSVNDTVVVARLQNRRPVVIGTYYSETEQVPDDVDSERHIGSQQSEGLFLHGPFGVVPKVSQDPSDPPDGSIWYNTSVDEYRGVENGTKISFNTTAV